MFPPKGCEAVARSTCSSHDDGLAWHAKTAMKVSEIPMGRQMIRDLEVRHCRALVAVHDSGGVSTAARVMGIAQSTVSETLLSLERLLGTPVTLRRGGREATLTTAGEALLPHARSLIAISEAALATCARQGQATIRLGTVESISSFLLPEPLSAFRQRWPQIDVQITIGLCEDLRRRVALGSLDAALTVESADGNSSELFSVELPMVVRPQHPLANVVVAARDLELRTFLLSDSEGVFNKLVRAWARSPVRPAKFESAGSVEGVKRGVLASEAIGVLPEYAVAKELSVGSLVALRCADPLLPVSLRLTTLTAPTPASPLASLLEDIARS